MRAAPRGRIRAPPLRTPLLDAQTIVAKLTQYVALLLALCVHETAHALAAKLLGDSTAEDQGRITLNPLVHADPIGTVLLPLLALFAGGDLFGWARPTPVEPNNFRRGWYARGRVLVAAVGPLSNLAQAVVWVVAWAILTRLPLTAGPAPGVAGLIGEFVAASVLINLILMACNFLPIPPLDGAHVVSWSLPRPLAERYDAFVGSAGLLLFVALLVPIFGGRSALGLLFAPVLAAGAAALDAVGA